MRSALFSEKVCCSGNDENHTNAGFRKQVIHGGRSYFPSSFLLGLLEIAFLQRADVTALDERQLTEVTGFGLGPQPATTDFESSELAVFVWAVGLPPNRGNILFKY